MISKAKRLLTTSPHELSGRARQELWKRLERLPVALQSSLVPADRAAGEARAFMAGHTVFFPSFRSSIDLAATARASGNHEREVLEIANGVVQGRVPVLGFGPLEVGAPPRWHVEPVSKREAPRCHWSRVPYLDHQIVGDHKILWEFNRHQYLVTLAQAWRFTGDVHWLATLREHLQSWMAENPVRQGVNWASSLEIAYRAISWLWALRIAGTEALPHLGDNVLADTVRMLQAHGRHVERYLSTWFSPNTHLTGEALGLLYLAVALPGLPESARWFSLSRAILGEQLFMQVSADGVYFEQATQYHRYTCDIYLHALVLADEAGVPFSAEAVERVRRAFVVLRALQRPDGTMALLGDDDGGRLVQLDAEKPHELSGLLTAAAAWLGDGTLLPVAVSDTQRVWLVGDRHVPPTAVQSTRSAAFHAGGLYVMADELPTGGHLTLSCGPHGALSCGHSHSDELSFELWAGGAPLFVDSGTCAYDGPERDQFRSTSAHNTLELGGEGVSIPAGPFSWQRRVDAVCVSWEDVGSWSRFEGYHDGYVHLAVGARHSRVIWRAAEGLWLVEDTVNNAGVYEAVVRWYLSPGAVACPGKLSEVGGANGWQHYDVDRPAASAVSLLIHGARETRVVPDEVSSQYGLRVSSHCLQAIAQGPSIAIAAVIIDWSAFRANALAASTSAGEVRLSRPANCQGPVSAGLIDESIALDLTKGRRGWHGFGVPRTAAQSSISC